MTKSSQHAAALEWLGIWRPILINSFESSMYQLYESSMYQFFLMKSMNHISCCLNLVVPGFVIGINRNFDILSTQCQCYIDSTKKNEFGNMRSVCTRLYRVIKSIHIQEQVQIKLTPNKWLDWRTMQRLKTVWIVYYIFKFDSR